MLRSSTRAEKVPTSSSKNILYLIQCCTSASELQSANIPTEIQNLKPRREETYSWPFTLNPLISTLFYRDLTLSHVQNGSSNLQPLLSSGHLQAIQQAHGMGSVLLCIKLCPFLIRNYRYKRCRLDRHLCTRLQMMLTTAYRVPWIPPQSTSCWGQTRVLQCNCTTLKHKEIRVMYKNQWF